MEGLELSSEFWKSAERHVLWNPSGGGVAEHVMKFLAGREDLAGHLVFRTSGTEGVAKYVCVSKAAVLASAAAVIRHLEVSGADRWLRALPLFHVGGVGVHARAHLSGSEVVVQEGRWDAETFVQVCRDAGVTLSALVPAQVFDLVEAGLEAPESLRAVVVGGGSLDVEVGQRAWKLGWPLLQSYGLSEGASQVATASLDSLGGGVFLNDALPVLAPWEVRASGAGLLELRGKALFTGYLREEAEGMVFEDPKREGWFEARDRVLLEEGDSGVLLSFDRREGEVVKIMGELVSLSELRARLESLSTDAGLLGRVALSVLPDERCGNRLVLAFEREGVESGAVEGLKKHFDEGLAGYERISEALAVEEIPGSGSGKIDYGRLNVALQKL